MATSERLRREGDEIKSIDFGFERCHFHTSKTGYYLKNYNTMFSNSKEKGKIQGFHYYRVSVSLQKSVKNANTYSFRSCLFHIYFFNLLRR